MVDCQSFSLSCFDLVRDLDKGLQKKKEKEKISPVSLLLFVPLDKEACIVGFLSSELNRRLVNNNWKILGGRGN